jgi:ABC-type multidrug transport system fused ATPase/permease subunit
MEILDNRTIVAIVYIVATLVIATYRPDILNLWFGIMTPILTYYFVKSTIEKRIFGDTEDLTQQVLNLLFWLLVGFLVITVFTYIYVHVLVFQV